MSASPKEGLIRAWAYALALAVLCLPIFNPDLFWHLSAARWILAHRAVPRTDSFSFTAFGAPWIDFEWGTQLAWYALNALGGLWALWLFKAVMLAAAFWPVDGLLREKGASRSARAGALALWLAAMLAQSDLRADTVSVCFFAVLLRRLESGRASFLFGFGLFALWANLHAGFILGFGLYALIALTARSEGRAAPAGLAAEATGAALGSLLNPYGAGLYRVLLTHASDPAVRAVMEWKPPSAHNGFQLPLMLAVTFVLVFLAFAARRASRFLAAAACLAACAAIMSARFGAYFAAAGAMFVFAAFPRPAAAAAAAGLSAVTALFLPLRPWYSRKPFSDVYVAARAADFVARERGALGGLRLFNQYEWGGYLGWRLGEGGRVFGDGRYLFHAQLPEINAALTAPENLADFAARHALDGFLIRNMATKLTSTRVYPRGATREFQRPWYVTYLPRARWALVYWDAQALVFVDRAKVPAPWLAAHEYRWLLPGDDAARADALTRGEIPAAALAAEQTRHSFEVTP
ncbi:MAG: hypothetical protein KGL74_03280 [Elusimicrobia bacterium]|nr:hypothetical protein [Elusimicrobiota bacterium]